jgi:hypothetical protein
MMALSWSHVTKQKRQRAFLQGNHKEGTNFPDSRLKHKHLNPQRKRFPGTLSAGSLYPSVVGPFRKHHFSSLWMSHVV